MSTKGIRAAYLNVTITDNDKTPEILAFLNRVNGKGVSIGVFDDEENAEKAHAAEFGVPERSVPSRPFLRQAEEVMKDKSITLQDLLGEALETKNMFDFYYNAGELFKGIVKNMILTASFWAEANTEFTIQQKGHDMPLRDTDKMLNSITARISTVTK